MESQTYAAIASARHRRAHRRRLPLRLLLLLLLAAAALALLFPRSTSKVLQEMVLRNPETLSFVQNYEKYKDASFEIDLSGDVTPGEVPHFLQWDQRWGYAGYGGWRVEDRIGLSGCGPTALSMVTVALTGNLEWNPKAVADFSAANGHYSPGSGTSWSLMTEGCEAMGLTCEEIPLHKGSMTATLDQGKLMIASVGPGDFTETGHFIVLCGWDGEAFEIRDPNSRANTEKAWTYEQLEPQIRGLWAFSG